MKKRFFWIIAIGFLTLSCLNFKKTTSNTITEEMPKNITHNLIISYKDETVLEALKKEVNEYKAEVLYEYKIIKGIAIKIPDNIDIRKAKAHFSKLKGVIEVEYDYINLLNNR